MNLLVGILSIWECLLATFVLSSHVYYITTSYHFTLPALEFQLVHNPLKVIYHILERSSSDKILHTYHLESFMRILSEPMSQANHLLFITRNANFQFLHFFQLSFIGESPIQGIRTEMVALDYFLNIMAAPEPVIHVQHAFSHISVNEFSL